MFVVKIKSCDVSLATEVPAQKAAVIWSKLAVSIELLFGRQVRLATGDSMGDGIACTNATAREIEIGIGLMADFGDLRKTSQISRREM